MNDLDQELTKAAKALEISRKRRSRGLKETR
jgi:hypothetical protein